MAYLKVDGKYVSINGNLLHVPTSNSGDGTDTSDATATPADILNGKTAYVNGEKLYGTHECDIETSPQTKTVVPNRQSQEVLPDDGYHLSKVTVEAIPRDYIIPSGSATVTENGHYNVTNLASVTVSVPQADIVTSFDSATGTLTITEV